MGNYFHRGRQIGWKRSRGKNLTLDIRGSLKNTRISNNPLIVIDELIANSIDAFLIRRSEGADPSPLSVKLNVIAKKAGLLGDTYDVEIVCEDNGCGLGPDQLKAFLTKDTSYKDDLSIPGIGKCKGTGRVQFFHHFNEMSISSIYQTDEGFFRISLPPVTDRKFVEEEHFRIESSDAGDVGTKIKLAKVEPQLSDTIFSASSVHQLFRAEAIKQHVLLNLLQRFVSLKKELGDFRIEISSDLNDEISKKSLQPADIPEHTSVSKISVDHVEGDQKVSATFTVTHYKLNEADYNLPRNLVGLCAKASIAELITSRYLKTKTLENNAIDGHFHIVLVEGALFDEGVNEQRDGFDKIPETNGSADLFGDIQVTFEDIYSVLDDKVQELITPPDWSRDKIVEDVAQDFGVSEDMLSYSNTRVKFGDTPSDVAKRALINLQEKVVDETSSLLTMKEAIKKLEPDSDDFRQKINDLSWEFASSLKTIDMANLSQLIVRRSNLIDVLDLAVSQSLKIQTELPDGQRRKNEALIHSIFFPMRKDSEEISDHDVWLLSEEYDYYNYIASDKPLSQIKWEGSEALFEDDIDEAVGELLARISDENSACRPDIALFHEEGSVVIVEFKAPGVSLDEHDNDLIEYATLLAAKSKGRLKKFYGYLIGDTVNPVRLRGYQPLPGASGFFSTDDVKEPTTQAVLGQLYSEVIFYSDVVDRARKRIGVYREKLNLPKT
jgi:hypothetical protein